MWHNKDRSICIISGSKRPDSGSEKWLKPVILATHEMQVRRVSV
jgi:hypothetical protein